jgi:hypothetical protein
MDTRLVREELRQRKEAHDGDVVAALGDVMKEVLEDVDNATDESRQALDRADAALKRSRSIGVDR